MSKICKDLFRNFPDFKGIKTIDLSRVQRVCCLETSLTSKGLRRLKHHIGHRYYVWKLP